MERPDDAVPASVATTVRREAQRGHYDRPTIDAILDAASLAHVGLVAADGRPVVIPTLFGRDGDLLYLHGSVASRLVRTLAGGVDCCAEVTLVDGLVLARSAFLHSMNYRSVVVLGRARRVEGDEQLHGLRTISDHLVPGRWDEVRAPTQGELRQTAVLALALDEVSAKVREGGPSAEPAEDVASEAWAGVLPSATSWGAPQPAHDLRPGVAPSAAVEALRAGRAGPG
jgi:nitroimidazol reductase NimA-like FMN-containing flavoprotein (pyridoxamine 5'-phosphate oxidase superfamily)